MIQYLFQYKVKKKKGQDIFLKKIIKKIQKKDGIFKEAVLKDNLKFQQSEITRKK